MDIRQNLIDVIKENGFSIEGLDKSVDIDLREYIVDSVQFIAFIISVENKFEIEIPDEYLLYENIASLNSFTGIVSSCLESNA